MTKLLAGKVALITGGARGIGAACARKLAHAGCAVAINYYNSSDEAAALCAELEQLGVESWAFQASVADVDSVAELTAAFKQRFAKLDFLISNAASGVLKPALQMNVKHWRWCLETNALSLVHLTQQLHDYMPIGGRVIALSSLGAERAIPDYAFIGASKAALESLVRSLSIELAPLGLSVNTISAGVVDTDALKHFPQREFLLDQFKQRSLAGRELTPADVANAVYLLCLPEAEMIKGQTLFVDAGYAITG